MPQATAAKDPKRDPLDAEARIESIELRFKKRREMPRPTIGSTDREDDRLDAAIDAFGLEPKPHHASLAPTQTAAQFREQRLYREPDPFPRHHRRREDPFHLDRRLGADRHDRLVAPPQRFIEASGDERPEPRGDLAPIKRQQRLDAIDRQLPKPLDRLGIETQRLDGHRREHRRHRFVLDDPRPSTDRTATTRRGPASSGSSATRRRIRTCSAAWRVRPDRLVVPACVVCLVRACRRVRVTCVRRRGRLRRLDRRG